MNDKQRFRVSETDKTFIYVSEAGKGLVMYKRNKMKQQVASVLSLAKMGIYAPYLDWKNGRPVIKCYNGVKYS